MDTLVNISGDDSADIKHLDEQSAKDVSDEIDNKKINEVDVYAGLSITNHLTPKQDCSEDIIKVHNNDNESNKCVKKCHFLSVASELSSDCTLQDNKIPLLMNKECSVDKDVSTQEDINGGIDSEDTFPEFGSSSDDAYDSDEMELDIQTCKHKSLSDAEEFGRKGLLRFAEVLLKCTLCTSIPIILTSEKCFLQHVKEQHLTKNSKVYSCEKCSLTFRTKEDLKEHTLFCNTASDEDKSHDFAGSESMLSPETLIDSNNDSDSGSSGHRQLRTKSTKKAKVLNDFESPKQLVDHTGIQTLNGSLDLSTKLKNANESISIKGIKEQYSQCPKSCSVNRHFNINFITEQIIKSDVQSHSQSNDETLSHKLPFVPSSTVEFGKYTKLVREGGNIVYFCQLCNWKSPMKANFQIHCNMNSHKSKLVSAENSNDSDSVVDKMNCSVKPNDETKPNGIFKIKNNSEKTTNRLPWDTTEGTCFSPKPDQSYFQQLRRISTFQGRTPVVSAVSNDIFVDDAHLSHKRLHDLPSEMPTKKRKKSHKQTQCIGRTRNNSDSDCNTKLRGTENGFHCASMGHLDNMMLTGGKSIEGNYSRENPKHFNYTIDTSGFHNQSFPDMTKDHQILVDLSVVKSEKGDFKTIVQNTSVFSNNSTHVKQETGLEDYILGDQSSSPLSGDNLKYPSPKFYTCHLCLYECSRMEEYEQHLQKVHLLDQHASTNLSAMPHKLFGSHFCTFQPTTYGSNLHALAHNRHGMQSGSGMMAADNVNLLHSLGSQSDTPAKREPDSDVRLDVKDHNRTAESSASYEMGENWRVQKLKDLLLDYVVINENGNVSRDFLLQFLSNSSGLSDVVLWSSACNRAIRELYPNSQALRKGKYKNYYFGVAMLQRFLGQEEITNVEGEPLQNHHHRDVNLIEKIVHHLHSILDWSGNLGNGVCRHDVLEILADRLQDPDVVNCGAQCNRAIKAVFPLVDMKRRGKFKTMYLGVLFKTNLQNGFSKQTKLERIISEQIMQELASPDKTIEHASKDQNCVTVLLEEMKSPGNVNDNIQNRVNIDQLSSCHQRESPELESGKVQNKCHSPDFVSQFLRCQDQGNDICDIHNNSSRNGSPNFGPRDDQLVRNQIQNEMDKYLTKFIGVSKFEHLKVKEGPQVLSSGAAQNGDVHVHINNVMQDSDSFQSSLVQDGDSHLSSSVQNGDDNDGDDELDSADSVSIIKG